MHSLTVFVGAYVILYFITPTNQRILTDSLSATTNLAIDGDTSNLKKTDDEMTKTVTYIPASTPARILECVRRFNILRCTKLFVLQKMERHAMHPRSGNLTKDFLDQFFGDGDIQSLISGELAQISDAELTQRVIWNFKRFFQNRNIQLHFMPGIMVKIVPSKENKIKLSLKTRKGRHLNIIGSGREKGEDKKRPKKKKPHSYKNAMIQLAVPVMIMPAILLGTFLPFILPALKMATFMSIVLNNSAFMAALLHAARTHVLSNDNAAQPVMYSSGYH